MIIIPSITLSPDVSRSDAVVIADAVEELERAGFSRVQLTLGPVDQRLPHDRIIEDILRDIHCPVQVTGRFEATEEIDAALSAGAGFVVLGSRALDEFDWLTSVAGRFPGQLLLSSPARERRARTRGAVRTQPLDLRDIAGEITGLPLAALVVEFAHDAAIAHPELALLEDVAEDVEFPVQVVGGSLDLATLRDFEFRGVGAVIIETARLSGEFDGQTLARSFGD